MEWSDRLAPVERSVPSWPRPDLGRKQVAGWPGQPQARSSAIGER